MKTINMKKALSLLVALTMACILFIPGALADDGYTVRIAYGAALCHSPLHIAIEKGYFTEEGLDFTASVMDTAMIIEAAATGAIDASFGLVGKLAQPLENGLPIQVTAGIHTGCIKIVVPSDSEINTVADLRGKRIGVASLADSPALMTRRALANAGVGVTDTNLEVEFVVFANADLPIAMNNGAIDAYAGNDPTISVAIKEYGFKTIMDTATDPDFAEEYCCVAFVTNEFAGKYPELAARYTSAILKAAEWIENNPEETAKIQIEKEYVAGEEAFNAGLLEGYNYIPSIQGGYDALLNALTALREIGVLQQSTDPQALTDASFTDFSDLIGE